MPRSSIVSRRTFLATLTGAAGSLGVAGCASRAPRPPRSPGPFQFLVVNDLHHASAECDFFFAQLISQMRRHREPEFCLVVGDLADKGRPESLAAIRRAFERLEIPYYPVPGNHDCDVEKTTRLYRETFPDRLNYHFAHEGWHFIGLDSTEGNNWGGTRIQPESFAWLDATLPSLDRTAPIVLFTHFPLAPEVNPKLTPVNAPELVARFDGWNLRCAFSGHYHARTERADGDAVFLTNACCSRAQDNHDGTIPEGYLVCTAHPDGRLEREFVRFAPAEDSVPDAPAT